MKPSTVIKELSVPVIGALFILCLLQPFDIDKIEKGRIFFIFCETALSLLSILLSYLILKYVLRMEFREKSPAAYRHKECIILYLINIPLLSIILLLFNSWYQGHPIEWGALKFYLLSVTCISAVLYIGSFLRIRNQVLKDELDDIKAINALLEERQQKIEEETKEEDAQPASKEKCTFSGQYNNASLEVLPEDIVYVESMANYADICYLENGELHHKTLRLTLKVIKETLDDYDFLVQCHRAFLVNLNFVVSLSKESTGYTLHIFGTEKNIPVSRSNTPLIKEKLQK